MSKVFQPVLVLVYIFGPPTFVQAVGLDPNMDKLYLVTMLGPAVGHQATKMKPRKMHKLR